MTINPEISLSAKAPSLDATLAPLSSIMQFQTQAQALKKAKATYDSDVSQRQSEASLAKTSADIAQQTAPAEIQRLQAAGQQALLSLNDNQRQAVGTFVSSLAGSDPKTVFTKLDALAEFQPQLKPAIDYMKVAHLQSAANDPKAFADTVKKIGLGTMTVPEQFQARTAQGPMVSNNQQAAMVNQNPAADVPVGQVAPGTAVQMQLPPTAPTFNSATNAPGYVGPNGQGGPQSGPALGAPEAAAGAVKPASEDWADTVVQAKKAQQNIGILQNIKAHSEGASVGVGSDRRALANGIAGLIGLDPNEMAKTDTDLLAKNSNMLALAGGNTDAARSLAEISNPNVHMTKEAINLAADQVIGQQKLSLAKQQYLQKYAGNPQAYTEALTKFSQAADPRVFEYATKTPEERKAMLGKMSKQDKADLSAKMKQLHELGINP